MGKLTIYKENSAGATLISNGFIDNYAAGANDIQLKVYLYIMRMTGAGLSFDVSDMADKFNHSEKDILRALRYWEKNKLFSLDYDGDQNLKAIHLIADKPGEAEVAPKGDIVSFVPRLVERESETDMPVKTSILKEPLSISIKESPEKRTYSADELNSFGNDPETSQILFVAEQYIGRTLSRTDMETLLFIHDELGFSVDLIDFLIQYCVDNGKKKFSYIEKVAMGWAEDHIETVRQAKMRMTRYNKQVYGIMQALGKDSKPTEVELGFISTWTKQMGFSSDIILTACERTVLATDKNRFQYCNAILKNWSEAGVKHLKDIEDVDNGRAKTVVRKKPEKKNGFNDFAGQREYNYNDLEKLLVSN